MSSNNNGGADNEEDLLNEYILSTQLLTDGEPVRCVTTNNSNNSSSSSASASAIEILTGSQGGVVSRIVIPYLDSSKPPSSSTVDGGEMKVDNVDNEPLLEIQPGSDANTRHPHQIVAILSSTTTTSSSSSWNVYATGCKDGIIRIMDGKTHELKFTLEGHDNAVTSLSWIESSQSSSTTNNNNPWLVSGSWDGTAKIWSLITNDNNDSQFVCLGTLEGHENTVSVAGLPAESDSIRKVVTVSAGIAEGNVIRGHTVRIWRLTAATTAATDSVKSELVSQIANDHSGPMRDVVYDPETHSIYTCSNDGTVKIRSATDGKCTSTLAYPGGDRPIFLSVCVVGDWKTKAVIAAAEDGNVVVWDVSSSSSSSNGSGTNNNNRDAQVIAHPGCVWKVIGLHDNTNTGSSDFVTACNDGNIRIFTRYSSKSASPSVIASFQDAVKETTSKSSSGPSPEEIAALPKWEMNTLTQGRSEGQVQLFQKDGKAIAAQWSASSQTWIEVGEVTGQNPNAGTLNGKQYDHVLPIEIDVPDGGVQNLQIGYNNGENPFVTAQSFIDEHMLDQNYLAQIADYIRQRAGESGPTLGGGSGGGGPTAAYSAASSSSSAAHPPIPMEVTPTYEYLPMKGYKVFDVPDKKGLSKVVTKIREFNDTVSSSDQLTSNEGNDILDTLSTTLSITNRYHSSTISDMELAVLHKMVTQWDAKHVFPALDLARMAVLHPDAASSKRRGYWEEVLSGALNLCLGMGDSIVEEVAVPMLTMRLIANSYKGGSGSASAAGSLIDRYVYLADITSLLIINSSQPFLTSLTEFWTVPMHVHHRIIRT